MADRSRGEWENDLAKRRAKANVIGWRSCPSPAMTNPQLTAMYFVARRSPSVLKTPASTICLSLLRERIQSSGCREVVAARGSRRPSPQPSRW